MIVGHIGGAGSPYEIQKSLRFRGSASAYLNRTPGVAGNRKTWTWSGWVKRGALGVQQGIFAAAESPSSEALAFNTSDQLVATIYDNPNVTNIRVSSAFFRDSSAWYHIMYVWDTGNVTAQLRARIYVNGVELTAWATNNTLTQNYVGAINGTTQHTLGSNTTVQYIDGYLSEINFIDGQALDPSYFGEVSAETGAWIPKKYTGTYGTNGFYLPFNDGSNLANLTADRSGNGNNWTANNISLTSGVTYDWMDDTPTNNFAVLSAVHAGRSTISNANLTASGTTDLPTIIPDSGTWYFERGGSSQTWVPPAAFPSGSGDYNFGQRPWQSTGPTGGQKALCTKNLPAPSILNPKKHFDVKTHVGNNTTTQITGVQFSPDFAWVKCRSNVTSNALMDSVRGAGRLLISNSTTGEAGNIGDLITSFNSDGITVNGTFLGAGNATTNGLNYTYVDWLWKAGGAPITNNDGSIQSQVSANPQAGFSIVTYTGTGANATVGHGLGVAPKMLIVKNLKSPNVWRVGHSSLTSWAHQLVLNDTAAQELNAGIFNSTAPTSSVFSVGTSVTTNENTKGMVAYCFAEISGYSKFGSYVGNGNADGPFVYCGFRPRYVLIKRADAGTSNWTIHDTVRETGNVQQAVLYPHLSNAEGIQSALDILSNGFKLRHTTAEQNGSGATYIFIAFAEQPFQFANAR